MKKIFYIICLCFFLFSCATTKEKAGLKQSPADFEKIKKEVVEAIRKAEELRKAAQPVKKLPAEKKKEEIPFEEETIKEEKEEKNITFNFKDAELKNIIQFMAKLSNLIVILDEKTVKGKISIKTPEKLSISGAYVVLMAILENRGLTLIKTDKFLKVSKKKDAVRKPVETFFGADPMKVPEEDRVITQIIPVNNIKSSIILSSIKPLISKTGHVFENKETNFVLITDIASNIKRILHIIKYLDIQILASQDALTEVYKIKYLKAKEMADALGKVFGKKGGASGKGEEVKMTPVESANAIIITAGKDLHSQIKNTLKELDVRQMQVLIEVKIIEFSYTSGLSFGVQLDQVLNAGVNAREAQIDMFSGERLADKFISFTYEQARLNVAIDALAKHNTINILSTPRLLTSDNQKASIKVGKEQPILKSVTNLDGTSGGTGKTVSDYTYKDIGIELEVTPNINVDKDVSLGIKFKVTTILAQETFPGGVTVPVIGKREAETNVTVMDRHTLVIGGLIRDSFRDERRKVPFLGDIPLLGLLFSHIEKINEKTELLIFITPNVIANAEEGSIVTQSEKAKIGNVVEETLEDKKGTRNSIF